MEKLTIEHLAPYLPHELKMIFNRKGGRVITLTAIGKQAGFGDTISGGYGSMWLESCGFNPILRPFSDVTKEITHKGETFVPMHRLKNGGTDRNEFRYIEWKGYGAIDNEEHETTFDPKTMSFYQFYMGESRICTKQYEKFQKLFEWHFDVFGLIPAGLAVSVDSITDNPYEKA